MASLQSGDPAPPIVLPSTDGEFDLSEHRGEWVVVYFYPKNFTPGCTTEACDFRDAMPGLDATVVGISPDPVERHREFRDEHGLPFELASDTSHEVAEVYGAYGPKKLYGREVEGMIRSTFLIAPDGTVAEAMVNVRSKGHVDRVARRLDELRS